MARTVPSQALEFDASGQPYSSRYADNYASRDGAVGQARHVFLGGNDLPQAWAGRRQFVIVETGFGVGNNFLCTWQAWRVDPQRPMRLHFVSVELHPLRLEDLHALAARPCPGMDAPELADLRHQLADRWPLALPGLHRLEFEAGRVVLTLALGEAASVVPRLQLGADAFYLDGFAPERNPRMWDAALIKALSRLARPGATAATYTCARHVRDALGANGFAVEIVPGYGHKREMLRARYRPAWKMRRHEPPGPYEGPQRAIVVGAGLAGCCCAFALQRRGWQVTLLERGASVAPAASGLPAGLLHPLLSADDNLASRLSRAGFAYGLAQLRSLEAPAPAAGGQGASVRSIWSDCGVFHQADDDAGAAALRAALAADPWPAGFAQYRDAGEVAAQLGLTPRYGGIWFPGGAVVAAGRWCAALLEATRALGASGPVRAGAPAHPPLELVLDAQATELVRRDECWQVHDALGRRHAAPVLVLANAGAITGLQQLAAIDLQQIGGRISLLQDPALGTLRAGISGDGYLVPPLLGTAAAVGATYELTGADGAGAAAFEPDACASGALQDPDDKNAAAHAANLQRLQRLLAAAPHVHVQGVFAAQRCVSPDRLPLAGRLVDPARVQAGAGLRGAHLPDLPRLPGLYCLAALGSRGLSLAALLGEHLAAQICGEPAPIESDLAAAVDPGRFVLRGR